MNASHHLLMPFLSSTFHQHQKPGGLAPKGGPPGVRGAEAGPGAPRAGGGHQRAPVPRGAGAGPGVRGSVGILQPRRNLLETY